MKTPIPTLSKKVDQKVATPKELGDIVAVLKNQNLSADYKISLIEAILFPAGVPNG